MNEDIKARANKVMIENGVLNENWRSSEYDNEGYYLMTYGYKDKAFMRLKKFCKRYNCSADYILGLSDKYHGN